MTRTTTDAVGSPDAVDGADRGVLTIADHAAEHLVEAVITRSGAHVMRPDVQVTSLTDDGVELAISVALPYPTTPLPRVLADLRCRIAAETARQLGRPVRRIDLTVSDFIPNPALRPRVS